MKKTTFNSSLTSIENLVQLANVSEISNISSTYQPIQTRNLALNSSNISTENITEIANNNNIDSLIQSKNNTIKIFSNVLNVTRFIATTTIITPDQTKSPTTMTNKNLLMSIFLTTAINSTIALPTASIENVPPFSFDSASKTQNKNIEIVAINSSIEKNKFQTKSFQTLGNLTFEISSNSSYRWYSRLILTIIISIFLSAFLCLLVLHEFLTLY